MHVAAFVAGIFLLLLAAVDIFETVVLPRRVAGRFRLTRFFYRTTWTPWSAIARRVGSKRQRETFLSGARRTRASRWSCTAARSRSSGWKKWCSTILRAAS